MATIISKPRVIKDFEKLDVNIQEQIKLAYPLGFEDHLISFNNIDGKRVSALPFEAEDKYYLVRMTIAEAQQIIEEDDDYDEAGQLREDVKEVYIEKNEETEEEHDPYADEEDEEVDWFPGYHLFIDLHKIQ